MKNKKNISIIIGALLLVLIVLAIIIFIIPRFSSKSEKKVKLEKYEISDLKEVNESYENLNIQIIGAYEGLLDYNFIKENDIKAYQFYAGINKSDEVETAKYVGFKLSDLLDESYIYEYSKLEFRSKKNEASVVREVNDNIYLVFKKDDKNIDMTLLLIDKPYNKSLEDVNRLYIENSFTPVE